MIDDGVAAGANTLKSVDASNAASPDSPLVGTPGMAGWRRASAIASALILPPGRYGSAAGSGTRAALTCFAAEA